MLTQTITIPYVQLTLEQLIIAVRQLEPEARAQVAQALLADNDAMDARFQQLIERLSAKPAVTHITDADIDAEIRAVRLAKG
jgi:hypothetical protein